MNAEAIAKLKAEMDKDLQNPYLQLIGNFLLKHLEDYPAVAEKLLAKDKTIAGSLQAMKSEAQKKQKNGMAMLTDAEGYAIVLKYFGIDDAPVAPQQATPAPAAAAAAAPPQSRPADDFSVSLDDFL